MTPSMHELRSQLTTWFNWWLGGWQDAWAMLPKPAALQPRLDAFQTAQGSFIAQPDGSARISASTKTGGEGTLQVDGGLSWFGDAQPLQLHIHGDKVLLANTSELRVVANPDLDFTLAGTAMELRGSVHVPEAALA